jgi:hypothetical protein
VAQATKSPQTIIGIARPADNGQREAT